MASLRIGRSPLWYNQYCIWCIPDSPAGQHGRTLADSRNIGNSEWLYADNRSIIFYQLCDHDSRYRVRNIGTLSGVRIPLSI